MARQQASEAALNADDEFTRLRVPDRAHRSKSDAGPRGGAALWAPMGIGGAMRATLAQPPAETGSAEREGLPNDAAREGTWTPVAAPRMGRNAGDRPLFLTSCARNSLGRHERRRSSPRPSAPPCPWSSIAFCMYTFGAVRRTPHCGYARIVRGAAILGAGFGLPARLGLAMIPAPRERRWPHSAQTKRLFRRTKAERTPAQKKQT